MDLNHELTTQQSVEQRKDLWQSLRLNKIRGTFENKSWPRNLLTNQIRLSSGLGHDFTKSLNKVVTDTKVCNY